MREKRLFLIDDVNDDRDFFYQALGEVDPNSECYVASYGEEA